MNFWDKIKNRNFIFTYKKEVQGRKERKALAERKEKEVYRVIFKELKKLKGGK